MAVSFSRIGLALDLASSYANVVLMALITLLVVPIYVHTLGSAQWGLVAVCMTVQGVLFSIDAAFAPLMLRDVARAARRGRPQAAYLRFLRLYAGAALLVFLAGQAIVIGLRHAPLGAATSMSGELAWALRIVLVQFLFQFANNAAIGYWYARERQLYANRRQAVFMLAKHGLALLLVTQFAAVALAYLLPFALIGALEFFLNLRCVRGERDMPVSGGSDTRMDDRCDEGHREDWRDVSRYVLAAGLGVLTAQIDRIVLSLTLPAAHYGVYFLVSALLMSLLSLQVPIHRAFLPRMAVAERPQRVAGAMRRTSLVLLGLPSLAMALVPHAVLRLWLHDEAIAALAAPTLRLMLIAMALIALYAPSATQLLSQHRYRLLALVNGLVLAVQLTVLIALAPRFGLLAGGLAWLGCGVVQAAFAAGLLACARRAGVPVGARP